jgi:hypothetical protein
LADGDGSKHQSLPISTGFNVTSAQHATSAQDVEGGQDDDEYLRRSYRLPQNYWRSVTAASRSAATVHVRGRRTMSGVFALANANNTTAMVHTFLGIVSDANSNFAVPWAGCYKPPKATQRRKRAVPMRVHESCGSSWVPPRSSFRCPFGSRSITRSAAIWVWRSAWLTICCI